ncbi:branched chain amino acid aminotransferase apoenzyme [Magnetococcus marinus MC-1]|uniref:Branched-chain-amino-acid aminotransferase n=1 Tax=Magnetococcus marinus (strain ATCC BAA-1437 / JCM 17883 / MC-1) TaxID=156889 RepID=A0L8S8_MAGMM|nr:branched-chain-amino-acid transaminase [Magnetococcus marinus]ABK44371.1 branched chain amino acid aminotransferase apoenzyme [Magnetococcus marinus MC-1]
MWDKDGKIWMDGQFVDWRDAKIHVLTHTLHYGMGVFEGIRCYEADQGPAIFRLGEHVERLFKSALILGMEMPYSRDVISQVCQDVIKLNGLKSGYIRPLMYYGAESMGINPAPLKTHGMVAAWAWGAYLGEEGMEKGIRIKTSSYTRHHPNVVMTRAKAVGNYPNSILAKSEALRCGYDEALLLDTEGYVAEGSGENLFLVQGQTLKTPPLDSALNGITRNTVMTIAAEMGLKVVEQRFPRDEVLVSDEAFFTGTAAEVTPIRELDDRQIGPGHAGPVTKEVQKRFFDIVHGRDPKHMGWLTPVI